MGCTIWKVDVGATNNSAALVDRLNNAVLTGIPWYGKAIPALAGMLKVTEEKAGMSVTAVRKSAAEQLS